MSLPVENISQILDNASTIEEYKNIRESFNLKDEDIKSLIKREYNKKIDAIKKEEKEMDKKYGKNYLDHLYRLRNPETKYMLLFFFWNESEISVATIGTKKQIIDYLKKETEKAWVQYAMDAESNEEFKERENRMVEIQDDYEVLINEEVDSIKINEYSHSIGATHLNEISGDTDMYILVKLN